MDQGKSTSVNGWMRLAGGMLLAMSLLSGCANFNIGGNSSMQQIDGTVTYRERMMLPPHAMVTVALEDVSLADAPSDLIAQTSFRAEGAPPWDYVLNYDPGQIIDGRRYNVRAKVTVDERLMFISTQANPVQPAASSDSVDIVVSRAGGRVASMARADAQAHDLIGTFWELTQLRGEKIDGKTDQRKLNMVLTEEDNRISGFSGCNQFSGTYTRNGEQLAISQLASTMMACGKGMEREQDFQKALQETTHIQSQGSVLKLLNDDDEVVLQFISGDQAS